MPTETQPHVFDDRICQLGEGPLWHPLRGELFWIDILNTTLMSRHGDTQRAWPFEQMISALGWIDETRLLVATETGLIQFDLETGAQTPLCAIEADNAETRSNDGRTDPWGGFWIGTMSKTEVAGAGALYRWFDGTVRQLASDLTVPNAICFDAGRALAYYADSPRQRVWKRALDPQTGWPTGEAELFLDFTDGAVIPDGAVTDAAGHLWIAVWDSACVLQIAPDGTQVGRYATGAVRPTCPAFGGADMTDIFVTTAATGLSEAEEAAIPNGATLHLKATATGLPAPRVKL